MNMGVHTHFDFSHVSNVHTQMQFCHIGMMYLHHQLGLGFLSVAYCIVGKLKQMHTENIFDLKNKITPYKILRHIIPPFNRISVTLANAILGSDTNSKLTVKFICTGLQ